MNRSSALEACSRENARIGAWRAQALSGLEAALSARFQNVGLLAAPLLHVLAVPGKRLRAQVTLAVTCLESDSWAPSAEAVAAAATVETIHEASLVHDDIVDGAEFRRNQPAVAARFGLRTAAMTGVYLAGSGVAELADICQRRNRSLDLAILRDLALSQILDSLPAAADFQAQYRRLLIATDGKTGALFRLAVRVGAMLTNSVDSARGSALDDFATALGRAFQIRDDLLDFENGPGPRSTGADDIQRGVMSWPLCLWAEMTGEWNSAVTRLHRCARQADAAAALHVEILDTDVLEETRALMARQLHHAARSLACLPDSIGRSVLSSLVEELRLP